MDFHIFQDGWNHQPGDDWGVVYDIDGFTHIGLYPSESIPWFGGSYCKEPGVSIFPIKWGEVRS